MIVNVVFSAFLFVSMISIDWDFSSTFHLGWFSILLVGLLYESARIIILVMNASRARTTGWKLNLLLLPFQEISLVLAYRVSIPPRDEYATTASWDDALSEEANLIKAIKLSKSKNRHHIVDQ